MDANESSNDVFDVDKVRQLVELMQEHDLNEISLRQGDQRMRLRRGDDQQPTILAPQPMAMAAPAAGPATGAAPAQKDTSPAAEVDDKNITYIKSPMVGTFYSKPNPNAEPYLKVGDRVQQETTVCIIEAMKMFNEIQAEVSGEIVAILADNEEPVDFDKPLFKVDTSK